MIKSAWSFVASALDSNINIDVDLSYSEKALFSKTQVFSHKKKNNKEGIKGAHERNFQNSAILVIIFWDILMFDKIFVSPQVKRIVIISNKHGIYERLKT